MILSFLRPEWDDADIAARIEQSTHPMSDTQWVRMLDFGVVSTIMFTYLLRPREKDSPISGSEFKLREGRVRRPPSKVHHDIAQNRRHPARVELSWRLAPYYELFIPTTCQLKAFGRGFRSVLNQVFRANEGNI